MAYSDITFNDRNPLKRWFQQRRLVVAARLAEEVQHPRVILDFGSGNGELCKRLCTQFPAAKIICYEPTPDLMVEAKANLAGLRQVEFCADVESLAQGSVNLLYCLEVFEHLPSHETKTALRQISRLMCDGGILIVGVPVEIGLPALYKGVFRMFRRFGEFDTVPKNVLLAMLGFPPKERPVLDIADGFAYHFHHLGFDHRKLLGVLSRDFKTRRVASSPISAFGAWLNPEIYFVATKAKTGLA